MTPTTPVPVGGIIPQGYNVVVEMYSTPKMINGVHIPDVRHDRENDAAKIARVVAMGPDCWFNVDAEVPRRRGTPRCSVGDYVILRSYAGDRYLHNEKEYRIIADDVVQGIVPDPASIRRAE